jgi:hypothetical protein
VTENCSAFYAMIAKNEDQQISMKVYNILNRKIRILSIIPNKRWEGADSLLGAIIRYEECSDAHHRVLKIESV